MEMPEKDVKHFTTADGVVADGQTPSDSPSLDRKQEKGPLGQVTDIEGGPGNRASVLEDAKDIVAEVIAVDDDPSISPWTFRMLFLGMSILAA